jgi:hypothetical protein
MIRTFLREFLGIDALVKENAELRNRLRGAVAHSQQLQNQVDALGRHVPAATSGQPAGPTVAEIKREIGKVSSALNALRGRVIYLEKQRTNTPAI